jgi:hypothetical protein
MNSLKISKPKNTFPTVFHKYFDSSGAFRPGDPTEDLVLYLGEKTDQIMLLVLGTRMVFPWLREDAYLLLGDPTLV